MGYQEFLLINDSDGASDKLLEYFQKYKLRCSEDKNLQIKGIITLKRALHASDEKWYAAGTKILFGGGESVMQSMSSIFGVGTYYNDSKIVPNSSELLMIQNTACLAPEKNEIIFNKAMANFEAITLKAKDGEIDTSDVTENDHIRALAMRIADIYGHYQLKYEKPLDLKCHSYSHLINLINFQLTHNGEKKHIENINKIINDIDTIDINWGMKEEFKRFSEEAKKEINERFSKTITPSVASKSKLELLKEKAKEENISIAFTKEEIKEYMNPDGTFNMDLIYNLALNKYNIAKKINSIKSKDSDESLLFAKNIKENLSLYQEKKDLIIEEREKIKKSASMPTANELKAYIPKDCFLLLQQEEQMPFDSNNPEDVTRRKNVEAQLKSNVAFEKGFKKFNGKWNLMNYLEKTSLEDLNVHKGKSDEKRDLNSSQFDWKDPFSKDKYKDEKLYTKNTPKVLREKQIFVGWKLEWKDSDKKWVDENGLPVMDEKGHQLPLPLFDHNGNIVFTPDGEVMLDGKFAKIPYNCFTGEKAQSNNQNTWCNFTTACEAVDKYKLNGIGIMMGKGIVGIDIDHIKDKEGNLTEMTKEILDKVDSYCEFSPSGTGIHAFLYGKLPEGRRRKGDLEMYSEGRFITLTGNTVPNYPVKMCNSSHGSEVLYDIHDKYMQSAEDKDLARYKQQMLDIKFEETEEVYSDDQIIKMCSQTFERQKSKYNGLNKFDELFYKGNWQPFFPAEAAAGNGQSPADLSLCMILVFYNATPYQINRIFKASGLMRDKWQEGRGDKSYGQKTIEEAFARQRTKYGAAKSSDKDK